MNILGIINYHRSTESNFIDSGLYATSNNLRLKLSTQWEFHENESFYFLKDSRSHSLDRKKSLDTNYRSDNLSKLFFNAVLNKEIPFGLALLYDKLGNNISLARNPFGTVPIYFIHIPRKFFAFSNNISQLVKLKEVEPYVGINSSEIFEYISTTIDNSYNTRTAFSNIKTVPPGHYIRVSETDYEFHLYQHYNKEKWNLLSTPEEFGEAFRSIFLKSISQSVHHTQIVGLHLSGGLDSSSVTASTSYLYPHKELHTFYANTKTQLSDESHHALAVANQVQSIHHVIDPGDTDLEKVILSTSIKGQPERSPISPAFHSELMAQAHFFKCNVLLTGHDGDSIVGHGRDEYIRQLFIDKEWSVLKSQLNNVSLASRTRALFPSTWDKFDSETKKKKLYELYFYKQITSKLKKYQILSCIELVKTAYFDFGIKPSSLLINAIEMLIKKKGDSLKNKKPRSIHSNSFESLINQSNQDNLLHYTTRNIEHHNQIIFKQNICINEEYFALSQYYNIDIAHPFFNTELYELCLAVPPAVLFNNGVGRSPLREAMIGILPETVRNRTDKASFSKYSENSALRLLNQAQDYLNTDSEVWYYVDRKKFRNAVSILQNPNLKGDILMRFFVNRTIYLAIWLHHARKKSFIIP